MKIIKNSKIVRIAILTALGVLALVIIILSIKNRRTTPSGYNKSIETTRTQPGTDASTYTDTSSSPAVGDVAFSSAVDALFDKYPWYGSMPIDTREYTIVWDFDKSQFRIRLKISSTSLQSTKDALLAKAVANLKRVVNEDPFEYQYYVLYRD